MTLSRRTLMTYGVSLTVLLVPFIVAFSVRVREGGTTWPVGVTWGVMLVAMVAGFSLISRSNRFNSRPSGGPMPVGTVEHAQNLAGLGLACFAVADVALIGWIEWRVGLGLLVVFVAYVLVWVPRTMRWVQYRSSVQARSTPLAAFELVSDPRNWHLYFPQLEVIEPLDKPLHMGSVIHDRVARDGYVIDADEVVVAFDPGRQFGTAIRKPRRSQGIYEFKEVDGGTEIEYTSWTVLTMAQAVLGVGLRRRSLTSKMIATRAPAMQRIKALLEAPGPATV